MVHNKLNRIIGGGTFEYGEHDVEIEVTLNHTYVYGDSIMNIKGGRHYYRTISVSATKNDEVEVTNENLAAIDLDTEPQVGLLDQLAALVTEHPPSYYASPRNTIPALEEQLEKAVQPVLEQLDEIYQFTTVEYDIDIDIGIERMSHEISWVEVEDELDRINQEINSHIESA